MPHYRLATPAKRDLAEILQWLLEHAGGRIALKIESELGRAFQALARNPGLGHRRPEITPKPALFSNVGRYVICYRVDPGVVVVIAVLHGSRDIKTVIAERPI